MNEPVAVPVTQADLVAFFPQDDLVWVAVQLFTLAIPLLFLFTGLGARLCSGCSRVCRGNRIGTVILFACAYLTLAALIALPVNYLAEIVFHRAWNAPVPSAGQWLAGKISALLPQLLIAALFVWIPYVFILRNPRRWWLYTTVAYVPLLVATILVVQVGIASLTTKYEPLRDPVLSSVIKDFSRRCGVWNVPVLVGGDDATVVGLGPFMRIELPRNYAEELTPPEQIAQVGHELKHFVMHDPWKPFALATLFILVGLWLVDRVGRATLGRMGNRFGVTGLPDPASLPLAIFILSFAWLVAGLPIYNAAQRHAEFEADRFALEISHENRGQALLQVRYSQYTLNETYWFHQVWRDTYPSQAERVRFANTYRPWEEGESVVYGKACGMH